MSLCQMCSYRYTDRNVQPAFFLIVIVLTNFYLIYLLMKHEPNTRGSCNNYFSKYEDKMGSCTNKEE